MGLMGKLMTMVFGGGRNAIRETVEVFRENAEASGVRDLDRLSASLAQHAAEFRETRRGFDAVMDGINRLPRPCLAFGTIGLFVAAMCDPIWFAERMQGLALVPDALWWLMGAVVSFYFGARHQLKGQDFQREIARTLTRVPMVLDNTRALRALKDEADGDEGTAGSVLTSSLRVTGGPEPTGEPNAAPNAALADWRMQSAG